MQYGLINLKSYTANNYLRPFDYTTLIKDHFTALRFNKCM